MPFSDDMVWPLIRSCLNGHINVLDLAEGYQPPSALKIHRQMLFVYSISKGKKI